MKSLMVDLETMATTPSAVILTLGAVHFDPYNAGIIDTLYLKFNIEDQDALKRDVDPGTIAWWAKQDPAIMEEAFGLEGRVPLNDAMDQFHKFAWGCKTFWSHGSIFDLVILENLLRQMNRPIPWDYFRIRDTRTLFDLGQSPEMPQGSKHNALEDAIRQAVGVQNVYKKLKIESKK